MTNTIQKKFKVSSTQLLYQSCPYQAITLFIVGPFLDGLLTNQNVFAFAYTPQVLVSIRHFHRAASPDPPYPNISLSGILLIVTIMLSMLQFFIVLSCLISVSVNFSTFLVIGKTSAVTYQVLGHLKTCLVLAFGYILLRDPFSWRNILGILIAVVGMVLYSYYCTLESQRKANEGSQQLPQVVPVFSYLVHVFLFYNFHIVIWDIRLHKINMIGGLSLSLSLSNSHSTFNWSFVFYFNLSL